MPSLRLVDEPAALPRLAREAVADALADHLDRTPRRDVVDRDDRVYRACVILARVKGANPFRATRAEIAERAAMIDRFTNERTAGNAVGKALKSLQLAGLLIARPFLSETGQLGGIEVELLFDPGDQLRARLRELATSGNGALSEVGPLAASVTCDATVS
jgi:hypothetical protein